VGYTVLGLIVIVAIGLPALVGIRPLIGARMRPATSRVYERTPQRVERGQYLATTVSACLMCRPGTEPGWKTELKTKQPRESRDYVGGASTRMARGTTSTCTGAAPRISPSQ